MNIGILVQYKNLSLRNKINNQKTYKQTSTAKTISKYYKNGNNKKERLH